jgi:hypothetical protein
MATLSDLLAQRGQALNRGLDVNELTDEELLARRSSVDTDLGGSEARVPHQRAADSAG